MAAHQSTTLLSSNLETLSYINGMVKAFKAFDSDNDSLITAAELQGLMSSLGYKADEQEVREMMRRGDADSDGLLSADEFIEVVSDGVELDAGELVVMLEAALSVLDGDEEGTTTVTGEELYEVLSCVGRLSMKDCMDIVASMDGDRDGAVSLEDLRLVVQALV